jgi:hypothetical protein
MNATMEAIEPAELRAPNEPPDWSTLASRAIDDVARMAQAEIHLAEASLRASLRETVNETFAMLAVAGFLVAGGICLLAALILLLHLYFEWWLAFALSGGASAIIGAIVALVARRPKKRAAELL